MISSFTRQSLRLSSRAREDVVDILGTRFVEAPQSIIAVINDINDLSILKRLLKRTITVGSLEEFEKMLER